MRCVIVINQLNNPIFLDHDTEFARYLNKRAVDLGLQEEDEKMSEDVDAMVVMQLFSPLVLSQIPLANQMKTPCTSIVCPGGLLLVFRKVDDIQYIAINGDGSESAEFLERKILVFLRMTKFLFGPVYTEIGNGSAGERDARWAFLRSMLNTWTHMAKTDQTFLVEALERLHVNQLVSEKCVSLLEKTVRKVQATADSRTQHAFLLVHTKLLALYSQRSSYELQPADLLLAVVLAKAIFPFKDGLEDLLSTCVSYSTTQRHYGQQSSRPEPEPVQEDRSDGEEEYHSAPTTPSGTRSQTPGRDTDITAMPAEGPDAITAASLLTTPTDGTFADVSKRDTTAVGVTKCDGADADMPRCETGDGSFSNSHDGGRGLSGADFSSQQTGGDGRSQPGGGGASGDRESGSGDTGAKTVTTSNSSQAGQGERDGRLERTVTYTNTQTSSETSSSVERKPCTASLLDKGYPPLSAQEVPFGTSVSRGLLQGTVFPSVSRQSRSSSEGKHNTSGCSSTTASDYSSQVTGDPSATTGTRSRSGTGQSQQSSSQTDPDTQQSPGYWPHTVFLQTPSCQYSPHALHCAQILPGITLVVVLQMTGYTVAEPLCQVFSIVQDLLQGRRNKLSRAQSSHVHEVIAGLLSRVQYGAKKFKGKARSIGSDLLTRWESAEMRERLISYLMQEEKLPMSPELESPLMEFHRRQRELFQQLFLVGQGENGERSMEQGRVEVSRMKIKLQAELMDYRDYLSVKAQRNITMTSYLDDFPGLVHFIYVDRQYHQMTAPSLNVVPHCEKTDGTLFLKEKIWEMYSYMMIKLREGYTSVLTRNGDFCFSYFLWFEDSMGNPVPVQEPYKPSVETVCPGTLTGPFYRRLRRLCFPQKVDGAVHCYEMFLMHIGLVTPKYVAAHCQKLARKLWEMSGEAFTPVNLL